MLAFFLALLVVVHAASFDPLEHLGGNSPLFSGPNVFGIPQEPPAGCVVDQAAFVSRHGSRYPDPGAYYQWTNLSAKVCLTKPWMTGPEADITRYNRITLQQKAQS